MEHRRLVGWVVLWLPALSIFPVRAQGTLPGGSVLRWTAAADWEYYRSAATGDGAESNFNSFQQKYSLGVNGFFWSPSFNRFSVGLDLYRVDTHSNDEPIDTDSIGYNGVTTFFPGRPFSVTFYRRSFNTNVNAAALVSSDRESGAWGGEWQLSLPAVRSLRVRFDRTRFELLSPVLLQERRKLAQMDLDTTWGRSDVSFQYSRDRENERVTDSAYRRENFSLGSRTRFRSGAVLALKSHVLCSDARFSTGAEDDLTSRRASASFNLLPRARWRLGWTYDFNDNNGSFLDSTSHQLRTAGQVKLGHGWESTGEITLGRLDTDSASDRIRQELRGIRSGILYTKTWAQVTLSTSYGIGYDRTDFSNGEDRRGANRHGAVNVTYDVDENDQIFSTLESSRDDTDATGVGLTVDETRFTAGWDRRLEAGWKLRTSGYWRDTVRDTFQFGMQESETIGVEGSMSHPRGGFSLSLSTQEGVSDFVPDPAAGSVFIEGNDLVNQSKVGIFGANWRMWRNLRLRVRARLEDREFSSIGKEQILFYEPRIDYTWGDWNCSLGFSHYERNNETDLLDQTLFLKVTRRFF